MVIEFVVSQWEIFPGERGIVMGALWCKLSASSDEARILRSLERGSTYLSAVRNSAFGGSGCTLASILRRNPQIEVINILGNDGCDIKQISRK
jgi:hypothetical protein